MYLSKTSLSRFVKCPAYGYYKYILQLVKKESSQKGNQDFIFGSLVHKALQVYCETKDVSKAIETLYTDPEGSLLISSMKNLSTADVLVRKEINNLKDFEILETEKDFHFSLGEHFWVGKWDAIIKDKGLIYVLDYKTTGDREFQLRPNDQIVSYFVGARKSFDSIGGVYIHVLRAFDQTTQLFFIRPSQNEIDEWMEDTLWKMKQITSYINLGIYPKNPASCNLYRRHCEYLPLCQSFGKTREIIMKTEYIKQNRRCLDEVE